MSDVLIRRNGEFWTAFDNERAVANSVCKMCVVKLMQKLTKNSTKYNKIVLIGVDGIVEREWETGNDWNNQEDQ